jgi:hypothetical protein
MVQKTLIVNQIVQNGIKLDERRTILGEILREMRNTIKLRSKSSKTRDIYTISKAYGLACRLHAEEWGDLKIIAGQIKTLIESHPYIKEIRGESND